MYTGARCKYVVLIVVRACETKWSSCVGERWNGKARVEKRKEHDMERGKAAGKIGMYVDECCIGKRFVKGML